MIPNMSKKNSSFFKNSKKSPKRPKNKNFSKMNSPCSFQQNSIPYLLKKFNYFSKILQKCPKRIPKKQKCTIFDEKCLSRFSNVHSVGIHVQKTLHLRETRGSIPPPRSPRRFQTLVGIGLIKKFNDIHRVERKLLLLINLESC